MLLPRFSIRWMLFLTALAGVFSLVLAAAFRQQTWAIATILGVAAGGLTLLLHAACYSVARVLASAQSGLAPPAAGQNPFRTSEPPPQILPPREPET